MPAVRPGPDAQRRRVHLRRRAAPRVPPISEAPRELRNHLPFLVLLAVGAALRVLAMIAYTPALMFSDSWGYLEAGLRGGLLNPSYIRPNGYPVILNVLTLPGRHLEEIVAIQHLAGLLLGCLIYAALLRARVPRLLALAAAALVLLDGYLITLEQYVMPDALFSLSLAVAALLIAWPGLQMVHRPATAAAPAREPERALPAYSLTWIRAGLAGLILAAAILQREAAIFAIPAFLGYLLWRRINPRALVAFIAALAIPVLAAAAAYEASAGVFGLSAQDGWTMYGRVAAFASCPGAGIPASEQVLCETARDKQTHPRAPTWYIWNPGSPAVLLFPQARQSIPLQVHSNRVLADFSHRIILAQPLSYLDATFSDFLRYFTPGATQFADVGSATWLPSRASQEKFDAWVRRHTIPNLTLHVRAPAAFVNGYRRIVHVPRPWLALLALASLLAWLLPRAHRPGLGARPEIFLLAGAALLMLLGTAATAGFGLRYLLPSVPLLAIGGTLALCELSPLLLRRVRRGPPSAAPSLPT